jgi:uncharacterized protein
MNTGPQAQYFDFLARGQHRIQRCTDCASAVFYPRVACPKCGGVLDWIEPEGAAVVYSTTTIRRTPEAGGDYNLALVDLAEGVRMMTRIVEIAPEAVKIGMPVRVAGVGADGQTVLYKPVGVA